MATMLKSLINANSPWRRILLHQMHVSQLIRPQIYKVFVRHRTAPWVLRRNYSVGNPKVAKSTTKPSVQSIDAGHVLPSLPPPVREHFSALPPASQHHFTKQTLLSQAPNALSRLLVHIRWTLTRNKPTRPGDFFSAFVSSVVMGNIIWIILGTTTFGLFGMYTLYYFDNIWKKIDKDLDSDKSNTGSNEGGDSSDKGILSSFTSAVLSNSLGVKFQFTKGHVLPEFENGMLKFKKVHVCSVDNEFKTMNFEANIESLNLSLSFNKWYEGNGLIYEAEINGLNGKVYEKNVDPSTIVLRESLKKKNSITKKAPEESPYNFSRFNENHYQYDDEYEVKDSNAMIKLFDPNYKLESLRILDSYVEVFEPDQTSNPMKIGIFNCELPKLSGDRLLLDFFDASNVTGSINDSMFSIHKHQQFNLEGSNIVRFKLDGINMKSMGYQNLNLNWIVNGRADIIADINLPQIETEEFNLSSEYKRVSTFCSNVMKDLGKLTTERSEANESQDNPNPNGLDNNKNLLRGALDALYATFARSEEEQRRDPGAQYVLVNVKIKFYDLKASLPRTMPRSKTTDVPFIDLQTLRSLITFINSSDRNPIVINTLVIEKMSDLYNVDKISETRMFDLIMCDIYHELVKMSKQEEKRIMEQRANMWSHSLASQLLLLGLGAIV